MTESVAATAHRDRAVSVDSRWCLMWRWRRKSQKNQTDDCECDCIAMPVLGAILGFMRLDFRFGVASYRMLIKRRSGCATQTLPGDRCQHGFG